MTTPTTRQTAILASALLTVGVAYIYRKEIQGLANRVFGSEPKPPVVPKPMPPVTVLPVEPAPIPVPAPAKPILFGIGQK